MLLKNKTCDVSALSGMLCVWIQGEKLARAADLVLTGNSEALHTFETNYRGAGVC